MRRQAYIGNTPSAQLSNAPQAEASAYFARMTTYPTLAFRDPVNTAIYKWKKSGAWSLLLGAWLHATETSQAALLNMTGNSLPDAVLVGSPTFTASAGFSGLNVANGVKWPLTVAQLVDTSTHVVFGGVVNPNGTGGFVTDNGGANDMGTMRTEGTSPFRVRFNGTGDGSVVYQPNNGSGVAVNLVGGGRTGHNTNALGTGASQSASTAVLGANPRTNPSATNPIGQLSFYGFISSSATDAQVVKFCSTLNELLHDLGALV